MKHPDVYVPDEINLEADVRELERKVSTLEHKYEDLLERVERLELMARAAEEDIIAKVLADEYKFQQMFEEALRRVDDKIENRQGNGWHYIEGEGPNGPFN